VTEISCIIFYEVKAKCQKENFRVEFDFYYINFCEADYFAGRALFCFFFLKRELGVLNLSF